MALAVPEDERARATGLALSDGVSQLGASSSLNQQEKPQENENTKLQKFNVGEQNIS